MSCVVFRGNNYAFVLAFAIHFISIGHTLYQHWTLEFASFILLLYIQHYIPPPPFLSLSLPQVDLIDMSPHQDGQYQWVGHYSDLWSCFHILFPLTSTSAEEVAQNLCRYIGGLVSRYTLSCTLAHTHKLRSKLRSQEGNYRKEGHVLGG